MPLEAVDAEAAAAPGLEVGEDVTPTTAEAELSEAPALTGKLAYLTIKNH